MDNHCTSAQAQRSLLLTIFFVLAAYILVSLPPLQLPQKATAIIRQSQHHEQQTEEHAENQHSEEAADSEHQADRHEEVIEHPPLWMVIPFGALLGAIAVLPLLPWTEHWWESNLHRFYVAAALGLVTLAYYLFMHTAPVEGHWPAHHVVPGTTGGLNWAATWAVLANGILHEYIPFIMLLFSLYTISGGIRVEGDLPAPPGRPCC